MEYEELRKYQRKEKNTAKLVELKKGFYEELSDLVSEKSSKYKEEMDPEVKKKLENIKKIARDLYKKRERKIISRALRTTELEEEDYKLLEREKKLFKEIREAIEEERKQLDKVLKGEPLQGLEEESRELEETEKSEGELQTTSETDLEEETAESELKNEEEKETGEGLNKVMVRILKEVPEFVSQNLQELGPYEPESTVEVPEKEAEVLVDKGLAERTNQETKEGD